MGLIRVSDEVEGRLKELSDGRTMTATVESLLRASNFLKHIDKRFDDLEAAIKLETMDTPRRGRGERVPIEYDKVWNLFFEILDDDDKAWFPYMSDAAHNSDCLDEGHFFLENGVLISDDMFGKKQWVRVSEEMEKFLI